MQKLCQAQLKHLKCYAIYCTAAIIIICDLNYKITMCWEVTKFITIIIFSISFPISHLLSDLIKLCYILMFIFSSILFSFSAVTIRFWSSVFVTIMCYSRCRILDFSNQNGSCCHQKWLLTISISSKQGERLNGIDSETCRTSLRCNTILNFQTVASLIF